MKRARSLKLRVVGYLILAQLAAFQIAAIVTMAVELAHIAYFRVSLDELAATRAIELVKESLVQDGERLRVDPSERLKAELRRTPSLRFAAFDDNRTPLAGSDPELAKALTMTRLVQMSRAHVHFTLPDDPDPTPLGYLRREGTKFGWVHVAVYRTKFRTLDVFYYILDEFKWNIVTILIVMVSSTLTAWLAVKRGLEPINRAAHQIESIDMDRLERGVPMDDAPAEVRPFIRAVDEALGRLATSAARMRRFTANVAHELRTPVAVMRARLENASPSGLRSDLLNESSQLQTLLEQLLITLRLGENRLAVGERVDLVELTQKVVAGFVLLAIKSGKAIEFVAESKMTTVAGNRRAIECVISNLVDNALRAEPDGGVVGVHVSTAGEVAVVDHGEGIDDGDRELIFEPFWRKSECIPGAGLGLSISRELVEALDGRLWVEKTPAGGATFKVLFALVEVVEHHRRGPQ